MLVGVDTQPKPLVKPQPHPLIGARSWAGGVERALKGGRPLLRRWARARYFKGGLEDVPLEKVLLVACHWIGDTFWATQVVPALEAKLPAGALHVATRGRSADLWRGLVPSERVRLLEHVVSDRQRESFRWGGLWSEAAALRTEGFDLVLDLTGNRYSALLSFLARPRRAFGCGGGELARLYSRALPAPAPGTHLALRPWYAAAPLLGPPPLEVPLPQPLPVPLDLEGSLRGAVHALGVDPDDAFVVLAPGAGWSQKRWPTDRFALLAAQLEQSGLGVVAVGGPDEVALLEAVVARTERGRVVAGASLSRTALLLDRARLVVANDSALGHLAAAQGVPLISLFGPTNPACYRPLGRRVRVLRAGCSARPDGADEHCHGRAAYPCPPSCWDALTTARVLSACRALLLG